MRAKFTKKKYDFQKYPLVDGFWRDHKNMSRDSYFQENKEKQLRLLLLTFN